MMTMLLIFVLCLTERQPGVSRVADAAVVQLAAGGRTQAADRGGLPVGTCRPGFVSELVMQNRTCGACESKYAAYMNRCECCKLSDSEQAAYQRGWHDRHMGTTPVDWKPAGPPVQLPPSPPASSPPASVLELANLTLLVCMASGYPIAWLARWLFTPGGPFAP